jgi:hypothetical protein
MEELIQADQIQQRIYRIRGQQVMQDSDLAEMYGVSTKRLNEQVRRNIKRFPPDFMFQMTRAEMGALRSQIATSKAGRGRRAVVDLPPKPHGHPAVGLFQGVLALKSASVFVVSWRVGPSDGIEHPANRDD